MNTFEKQVKKKSKTCHLSESVFGRQLSLAIFLFDMGQETWRGEEHFWYIFVGHLLERSHDL